MLHICPCKVTVGTVTLHGFFLVPPHALQQPLRGAPELTTAVKPHCARQRPGTGPRLVGV